MIPFKLIPVEGLTFDLMAQNPDGSVVALKDGVVYTFSREQIWKAADETFGREQQYRGSDG